MEHIITGGIETCLLQLLSVMKDNPDLDITVITKYSVSNKSISDFFVRNKIALVDYDKYYRVFSPDSSQKILDKLYWKIRKRIDKTAIRKQLSQYDLLIDYFNGSFFGIVRKVNKPKIAVFHGAFEAYLQTGLCWNACKVYDKIVCISESFYKDIQRMSDDNINKYEFIYNPIDVRQILSAGKEPAPMKIDSKYFIMVARLHPDKDHETLLRAFKKFLTAEKNPDVKLVLCGTGPLLDDMQKMVSELKIDNNVIFMGDTPNPHTYVRNAMAHILSTYSEGLSMVLIEAQILGTVNVASCVKSGIQEVLMYGDAGFLFPQGGINALSKIMSKIYHNEFNKNAMIKCAQDNLYRFDAKNIANKFYQLFNEVIQGKKTISA